MLSQCPKCSLSKSTGPMGSVLPQCQCDWKLPTAQPQQETDAWHEIVLNQKQFLDKMELLLAKTAAPPQPEQEPVAWPHKYGCRANAFGKCDMGCTTPPQRTWVSLTLEKIWQIATDCTIGGDLHADKFARAIESRLKELNT